MPFKKGESGNPQGKPEGTVSEKTKLWNDLKEWMIEGGAEKFKVEMNKLEGKEFIQAYTNILEFFKPKLARTDLTTKGEKMVQEIKVGYGKQSDNKD